ncbi:MAG: type 4a pilus biogenesis protein PilO [Patescibacteria group bacterium]|nr:type 4a pilus biogenesis protein PilO [Patescibacteria group bacterium]
MSNNTSLITQIIHPVERRLRPFLEDTSYRKLRGMVIRDTLLATEAVLIILIGQNFWMGLNRLLSLRQENNTIQARINLIQSNFQTLQKSPSDVNDILDSLPDISQNHNLLDKFETLASQNGVSLLSISYADTSNVGGSLIIQPVKINLSGTFERTLNFIRSAESGNQPMTAEHLQFSSPSVSSNRINVQTEVNLQIFYSKN